MAKKITNKEFEAEFSRLIEEGYDVTRKQLADQIIAHGHELEEPWSAVPARFKEGLGEYVAPFSPKSKEGEWQVPPVITEGVPSALQLLAGGVQYLGEPPGFTLNPLSLAGKGLSRVLPDYTGMVDAALEGAGDFVEDPIRTAKYYPAEVVTTLPSLLAPALGAASKVPAIATKLPKLASGLQKTAKVAPMVSDPLGELSGRAVGGLGSLAVQGVSEFAPVVGRRSKRRKLREITSQSDPDMVAFQQEGIERGVVDPVDLETGEGGFPAAIVSQDPGARRVTKNIAQKGGDNAVFREINQVKDAIDAEESFFVNSFDASNPVEAINSARQGLDRLDKNYEVMKTRFKELGLDEMETDMSNIRQTIAGLEGQLKGDSVDKAVQAVMKDQNVQAFKKKSESALKRREVLDSGPQMDSEAYSRQASVENQLRAVPSQDVVSYYEEALRTGNTEVIDVVEQRGREILENRIRQGQNTIQDQIRQEMDLNSQQDQLVGDAMDSNAKFAKALERESNFLTDYESKHFPFSDPDMFGGRSYRLVPLEKTVPGSGGSKRRIVDQEEFDQLLEDGRVVDGEDGIAYAKRYFDDIRSSLEAEHTTSVTTGVDPLKALSEGVPQIQSKMDEVSRRAESILNEIDTAEMALNRLEGIIGRQERTGVRERVRASQTRPAPTGQSSYIGGKRMVDASPSGIVTLDMLERMRSNLGKELAEWQNSSKQSVRGDYADRRAAVYNRLYAAATKDLLDGYAKEIDRLAQVDPQNARRYGELSALINQWRETSEWLRTEPARIVKRAVESKWVNDPEGRLDANGDIMKVPAYSELDASAAGQIVDGLINEGWKINPSMNKFGTLPTNEMPQFRETIGPENWTKMKVVWLHRIFEKARGPSGELGRLDGLQNELGKLGKTQDDINRRLVEIGGGGEEGRQFKNLLNQMASRRVKVGERMAGVFDDSSTFNFDKVKTAEPKPSKAWDLAKAVGMTEGNAAVLLGQIGSVPRMVRSFLAKALVMGLERYGDMLDNPRKYKMTADDLADAPTFLEMVEEFKNLGLPVRISRISRQVGQKEARDSWQDESKVSIDPKAQESLDQILKGPTELDIQKRPYR